MSKARPVEFGVSKGTYTGGGTIVNKGPHGDPSGRGLSPRGSPRLTGSRRYPSSVLAQRIPYLLESMKLVLELHEHKRVRLPSAIRARKVHAALASFETEITSEHRNAY